LKNEAPLNRKGLNKKTSNEKQVNPKITKGLERPSMKSHEGDAQISNRTKVTPKQEIARRQCSNKHQIMLGTTRESEEASDTNTTVKQIMHNQHNVRV
jgi:hypothetical protein